MMVFSSQGKVVITLVVGVRAISDDDHRALNECDKTPNGVILIIPFIGAAVVARTITHGSNVCDGRLPLAIVCLT